jgi:hypothetical protein
MRVQEWMSRLLGCGAVAIALSSMGCKTVSEKYISLEVWKYEKCFGHLPPGFVPPGAMAQAAAAPAAPRVCGQGGNCAQAAPCAGNGGEVVSMGGENCNSCQGGVQGGMIEGGLPAGTTIVPGSSTIHQGGTTFPGGAGAPILPSGPGGAPGPVPSAGIPTPVSAVSTSRPVVISDEVVLP